jgi:hypothetical protein
MSKKFRSTIFVSDCGGFIAAKIPGPVQPAFDVWREDGSEMWIGNRYVKAPGTTGFNPQSLYLEDHARSTVIVGSWTNLGHEKRDGSWAEAFDLGLYNLETGKHSTVRFRTPLASLAPLYEKRRLTRKE